MATDLAQHTLSIQGTNEIFFNFNSVKKQRNQHYKSYKTN